MDEIEAEKERQKWLKYSEVNQRRMDRVAVILSGMVASGNSWKSDVINVAIDAAIEIEGKVMDKVRGLDENF